MVLVHKDSFGLTNSLFISIASFEAMLFCLFTASVNILHHHVDGGLEAIPCYRGRQINKARVVTQNWSLVRGGNHEHLKVPGKV